jgi:hypothetical protein
LRRVFLAAGILAVVSAGAAIVQATGAPTPTATPTTGANTIDVNPKSISFPNKAFADRGATSNPVKVIVTNPSGGSPLTLLEPTISEGFVVTSNKCVGELAPGKTCELEIAYSPTMVGVQQGKLRINTRPASGRHTVKLKGKGVAPAIKIKPKTLDFGQVQVGATGAAKSVTLTNPSPVSITLTVAPAATPPYNVSAGLARSPWNSIPLARENSKAGCKSATMAR